MAVNYIIGSLFPRKTDGSPNIKYSSSLVAKETGSNIRLSNKRRRNQSYKNKLVANIDITSDPINIKGSSNFAKEWLIPQITNKTKSDGSINSSSIFGAVQKKVVSKWTKQPKNQSMKSLIMLGYIGPGSSESATNNSTWNSVGSKKDKYYQAIQDLGNYDPRKMWANYNNNSVDADVIKSDYDERNLLQNLNAEKLQLEEGTNPNLWYPAMLYSYGLRGEGTSYPGPVLITQPGDQIRLNFNNDIRIGELNNSQIQQATLVPNSTYGNGASDGLGGTTSLNYHLHGSHTNPTGFGDNVVSRFTTGQKWTTIIDLPEDHGQGSYWYHPHYHPSVNQQVYGGASGFMQVGDPLSKIPAFKDIPRNLAVLKMLDIGIDTDTGSLQLAAYDNYGGPLTNAMTMVTVNGEFQPEADAGKGGWQSITFSNQANQAFYNASLIHQETGERLPLYIYGEDGHQFPKIRAAKGTLTTTDDPETSLPTEYKQQENVISLAPGKRVDVLAYLPGGTTEIVSNYTFSDDSGNIFKTENMGNYPDLSTTAKDLKSVTNGQSAGPMATFVVNKKTKLPSLGKLNRDIRIANKGIEVQKIKPSTKPEDYDTNAVPSINLFDSKKSKWKPLRKREFNWAKGVLVGDKDEWDLATQERVSDYNSSADVNNQFEQYDALSKITSGSNNWFGYNNPFLINDHVFPNGSITIAQLGTMEEWNLRNWSVNGGTKYIGHPFHIHINDYQTKNSDTELDKKRSLEDVTMLNSSGYKYYDTDLEKNVELKPLQGKFHEISAALDKNKVDSIGTWGANDQTVRMLFQDYLGTYVFHCHILPHEDAGMMQVITIVENTDSSWITNAESDNYTNKDGNITLRQAQDFSERTLKPENSKFKIDRMQSGDLNYDFTQDIVLSRRGSNSSSGHLEIYDGAAALKNKTTLLSKIKPYKSKYAPWAFIEDFTGDGNRDLVTAGFSKSKAGNINLQDLQIKAWTSSKTAKQWKNVFDFNPFADISTIINVDDQELKPVDGLDINQVGVAMADMNLDNFQDIAVSYAVDSGLRVVVLDGAAMALNYQTGTMEGGYFPNDNVLADAVIQDKSLQDLSKVVLTSGFSSYAQSALEDLIITTHSESNKTKQVFTTQLQAGHFIATSEMESSMDGSTHSGHGAMVMKDDRIENLRHNSMPLSITETDLYSESGLATTPVIAGVFGTTGLITDDQLVIAQGVSNGKYSYGNSASSKDLFNSSQQLAFNLNQINKTNRTDLIGAIDSELSTTFKAKSTQKRINMANLTYQVYANQTMAPGDLATAAGAILGQGQTAQQLAEDLINNPKSSKLITASYGGSLSTLPIADVITGATKNLYGRTATKGEIRKWSNAVKSGLDQSLIPLSILQNTGDDDIYRTALMSSIAQWNQVQWSTNANQMGSFGQGLQSDEARFQSITSPLDAIGSLSNWRAVREEMTSYTQTALNTLIGTDISKSGFF